MNSEEPDQMPQSAVSDLLFASRILYQNLNKNEKYNHKIGNWLIQLIRVGNFIQHNRVLIMYQQSL